MRFHVHSVEPDPKARRDMGGIIAEDGRFVSARFTISTSNKKVPHAVVCGTFIRSY